MNIAISFCGEGLGHTSRMSAISNELKKYHDLTFWCPIQVESFFKQNYSNPKIYSVPLLSLVKENNKINIFKTIKTNYKNIIFDNIVINNLVKQLINLKIEIVISDYEPFLAKAAKKAGIPLLLFNHPGIITKFSKTNISYFLSKITANFMMPFYKKTDLIISSFYHGDVGPIIRNEIKNAVIKKDDFVLVYLKTSLKDKLLPVLNNLKGFNFKYFPNNEDDFISSLTSCKAVIGASGHQLISECLYLKKPILVIPEKGQYEQFLNAEMLIKTGLGSVINEKNISESIIKFLNRVDKNDFIQKENLDYFNLDDDLEKAINKINIFLKKYNLKEPKKQHVYL
ncbi:MAG: glycosyltransferase family protein [Cyanobacteriota bacterium]